MDIEEVQVYDPKSGDRISYTTYLKAHTAVSQINPTLANAMGDGLTARVANSAIGGPGSGTMTLRTYLKEVYFPKHKDVQAVVFIDGRFERSLRKREDLNMEELARQRNSFPSMFMRPLS